MGKWDAIIMTQTAFARITAWRSGSATAPVWA